MKVLVTGGLGYIGSHTVVELIEEKYQVVIADDLSNSKIDVLENIVSITGVRPVFYQIDIDDINLVAKLYDEHPDIIGIIHFAAFKSVSESVQFPNKYYRNNINPLLNLFDVFDKEVKFIFSSSCTVYGQSDTMPIDENAPLRKAHSPYGYTKQIGERIVRENSESKGFSSIILRYFNPIGAHHSAKIGELPLGVPQNLIPFITQTAAGIRKELLIFGDDYPTPDGTCIRDYIHVSDLAKAHVMALQKLIVSKKTINSEVFNLGTGRGSSVLEVVQLFEKVNQVKLPSRIVERRVGDITEAYAKTDKAGEELGWSCQYTLEQALKSAWQWEKTLRCI